MRLVQSLVAGALVVTALGAGPAAAQAPARGASAGTTTKLPPLPISADFPYTTRFVRAAGVRLAYVSEGSGDPVVFIHGNPTSKYLWRNVIPYVADRSRAIALDLPGMGESDKPEPALGFQAQAEVFAFFVEALHLRNITLVVHDWGAAIGFDYARRHPERVRGIAFMEGVLPPVFPQPSFDAMGEEMGEMFRMFKDPVRGRKALVDEHMFVEEILPGFVNRALGPEEMAHYRRPFVDPKDREMILLWPRELPIAGEPAGVVVRMNRLAEFMTTTDLPILVLYADPGVVVQAPVLEWYVANLRNVETAYVGQGLHYIQEDQPHAVGRAVREWMRRKGWRADR